MKIKTEQLVGANIYVIRDVDDPFGFHVIEDLSSVYYSPASVDVEDARRIINWISMLPHKGQMRCHIPKYAIEFGYCDHDNLRLTICFECNNIIASTPQLEGTIEFDSGSALSQKLLGYLNAVCNEA